MQPGDEFEMTWDGTYYEIDDERGCYVERTRDADFELQFCYGHEIDGGFEEESNDGFHEGATITDEVRETQAFDRGGVTELLAA